MKSTHSRSFILCLSCTCRLFISSCFSDLSCSMISSSLVAAKRAPAASALESSNSARNVSFSSSNSSFSATCCSNCANCILRAGNSTAALPVFLHNSAFADSKSLVKFFTSFSNSLTRPLYDRACWLPWLLRENPDSSSSSEAMSVDTTEILEVGGGAMDSFLRLSRSSATCCLRSWFSRCSAAASSGVICWTRLRVAVFLMFLAEVAYRRVLTDSSTL
mmetsp:Transcript_22611/g.38436  ORF Transcript_22611/g.38436 Transcript_22611/m.38436 type:complete len:219 (+) Transcript_22611:570-1226(+)